MNRHAMYELFDHTADLGLRVRAESLDALFAEAGKGFTAMLVDEPQAVAVKTTVDVRITGTDREYLMFDWLDDQLHRFDSERFIPIEFEITVDEHGLSARIGGETYDETRHRLSREIKAITYHGLTVRQDDAGWLAEVIVDI